MKLLAIETTDKTGTVAAMEAGRLIAERELDASMRSAQSLTPAISTLCEDVGWRMRDVERIAVVQGPGSFTGLRVGVMTAKTLAYVAGAEVLAVDALEAIAWGMPETAAAVDVAIDAQRGEVVAQRFKRDNAGNMAPITPQRLIAWDAWIADAADAAPLASPLLERKRDRIPEGVSIADSAFWRPRASVVARLAEGRFLVGESTDLWKLAPRYSRLSAAEERWAEKNAAERS